MMKLIAARFSKSCSELTRQLKDAFFALEMSNNSPRTLEEIEKLLEVAKDMVVDEAGNAGITLCSFLVNLNLIEDMIYFLPEISFVSRGHVMKIIKYTVRNEIVDKYPSVKYYIEHPKIFEMLVNGYDKPLLAWVHGSILRDLLSQEKITRFFFYSDACLRVFEYVEDTSFDVSCDALTTIRDLYTRHPHITARYIEDRYDVFVEKFNKYVQSTNYVTKKQFIKLLGHVLVERYNFSSMRRYVRSGENLVTIMDLMHDKAKGTRFEAYHVFVVNPEKSCEILNILLRNRYKLMDFVATMSPEKKDKQFDEEKLFVMRQLYDLNPSDGISNLAAAFLEIEPDVRKSPSRAVARTTTFNSQTENVCH